MPDQNSLSRQSLRAVAAEHYSFSPLVYAENTIATMFEEASEVFDNMFKSSFPLTFIVFIPAVLILVSPLPAEAAHEFTVYRMQQYDLQGQPYGETAAFLPCLLIKRMHRCVNFVSNKKPIQLQACFFLPLLK